MSIPQLLAFVERADVIRGTRYSDSGINDSVHSDYERALQQLIQLDAEIFSGGRCDASSIELFPRAGVLQYLLGYFGACVPRAR
ncbi:hypothetical protein CWS02_00575 [Enterobacter sp. EA-1]|nr:hypothetical protein CWS02_00575 [Enterobacter sp. EA-1]